jgi:hypothetical protein
MLIVRRKTMDKLIPGASDIIKLLEHVGFKITPSCAMERISAREERVNRELAAIFLDYGNPNVLGQVKRWLRERTRQRHLDS